MPSDLQVHILQKQLGCFNNRVVTLVADIWRDSGYDRLDALVLKTNCIRQPKMHLPGLSYNQNTLTTLRTSVNESLQMHFKVSAERSFHVLNASRGIPHRCSEGCSVLQL